MNEEVPKKEVTGEWRSYEERNLQGNKWSNNESNKVGMKINGDLIKKGRPKEERMEEGKKDGERMNE